MSTAIQAGGMSLILGAIAATYALLRIATRPVVGHALSQDVAVALLIAAALLLLGLPGLYAAQREATGVPGLVGHGLIGTGVLLLVVVAAGPIIRRPTSPRPSIRSCSGWASR